MDIHTFTGKRRLGTTDLNDFTDFQGIGSDPLYKRYASVQALVDSELDGKYRDFLAQPDYDSSLGKINWYIPDWEGGEVPVRFTDLPEEKKAGYEKIKKQTVETYRKQLATLRDEDLRMMAGALKYIDDDFIYCSGGNVYLLCWGMTPDKDKHIPTGELVANTPPPPQEPTKPVEKPKPVVVPPVVPPVEPPEPPVPVVPVLPPPPPKKKWWQGRPWWWWLIWGLLLALIVLLILWLSGCFKNCHGHGKEVNGIVEPEVIVTDDGDSIEWYGPRQEIILDDGRLPEAEDYTPPVYDEDGQLPPIVREEGVPPVFGNRLILFMTDENGNIDDFANAFKQAYPGDEYRIIGYDRYVKSLVIEVPEQQRERLKSEIEQKMPGFPMLIFDEMIYEYQEDVRGAGGGGMAKGWHLRAVNAQGAWDITKGSRTVKVAVIDDGIDRSHSMFGDRIVNPYNVFTRDNRLSKGEGHGTMVAGLAVGSIENAAQGAAGIAPDCLLIPVQVSDNGIIPLSALVSGIMYAVHQDADVINVSIAPQLQGLNMLPFDDQVEASRRTFLNVARLWDRVCSIAQSKNSIIVFAAGNDDILSSIPPENRNQSSIVVGAVNEQLYPTEFTNYGYCTDISAPGQAIYSSFPVNSYNTMDGTSFAAPIVTGAVALMKSIDRNVTVEQARNVMYRTGKQVYGFMPPMVNIPEALKAVQARDFSRGEERRMSPVPEAGLGEDPRYESWVVPGGPIDGTVPGTGVIPGDGGVIQPVPGAPGAPIGDVVPGNGVLPGDGTAPGTGTPPGANNPGTPGVDNPVAPGDGTDYDFIRRKIRALKEQIEQLERQLPENNRRE